MGINADRFWSKVDKAEDCWLWKGGKMAGGYGKFYVDLIPVPAHRVAFELTYGSTEGRISHTCGDKMCVNPAHLITGGTIVSGPGNIPYTKIVHKINTKNRGVHPVDGGFDAVLQDGTVIGVYPTHEAAYKAYVAGLSGL